VNWLKPMLLMIVLGGILYGVYTVLNKGPAPESAAGGREWAKPPDIQLGVVDDGKGGPPPISANNPDVRMESGGAAAAGQATLPRMVYPTNPASADPAGVRGDTTARQPAPVAGIAPSNDMSRGDPSNPAVGFPAARDPAASAVLGPRPDDASKAATSQESFAAAIDSAKGMLGEGKLVEALRKLTKWYGNPQLNADESRQLIDLLGQLAGTVVYSRQHLLQPPYKVQPGNRLETIAAQCNVPWQLLAKINGIEDPNRLNPGDELKIVRGPFAAIVDLEKRQLTLIVDDCYAGRFSLVGVGDLARNIEGRSFDVGEKLLNGPVSGREGSPIHHWIRLGNESWIVGTSDPATIHPAGLNLNSRDAEDVFDILSVGSRVVVRR
jgi:LysM domain